MRVVAWQSRIAMKILNLWNLYHSMSSQTHPCQPVHGKVLQLAAAYRAPEVGVALVIDPKHELGRALRSLESCAHSGDAVPKRLRLIEPEQVKIDLMSTQAWNLGRPAR